MAKLKLQPDPTFKAKVEIAVPGSAPATVTFTFKYRSRPEMERLMESVKQMETDVELVMSVACGWDLADDFNEVNVQTLVDSYISSPASVFEVYCAQQTGFRAKN